IAPVKCAVGVARALQSRSYLRLRMGLHTGPVDRSRGLDAEVTEGGISLARWVTACGDTGHILLSAAIAELLGQLHDWSNVLQDLGEYEVHPGVRLGLFNLYTHEVGNPRRPVRLGARLSTGAQVVLVHRRGAQPEEELLERLTTRLVSEGCDVFIDQATTI